MSTDGPFVSGRGYTIYRDAPRTNGAQLGGEKGNRLDGRFYKREQIKER